MNQHINIQIKLIIYQRKSEEVKWSRKEGESYEIPLQHSLSLESSANCQILKFSSLGRLLVCGCGVLGQHFLFFYDIPSGKVIHKVLAHSDVIYDLDWSEDDENMISASADYCVKLWNIKLWKLICAFVHPSFVYSAKFQPTLKDILVTGCYDHVIRIWNYNKSAQLLQELEGHNVAVNSLCWNKKTMKLFSADSAGKIKVWKVQHQRNASKGFVNYELEKGLNFPEIKGISVDKIIIPVSGNALFLFFVVMQSLDLWIYLLEKFLYAMNLFQNLTILKDAALLVGICYFYVMTMVMY
ncbi:hypothetical protein CEXT_614971 [Caerostris extrusa]|uniref:Uncharacterized protein n=1 Tax=Caerostris extrusa TaxID=172846 RepID=A0AAV4N6P4_CAEEX|nr:hypothetical protein CEXT_614971 [Caerostris extrusa]